jgi:hypothetical protein
MHLVGNCHRFPSLLHISFFLNLQIFKYCNEYFTYLGIKWTSNNPGNSLNFSSKLWNKNNQTAWLPIHFSSYGLGKLQSPFFLWWPLKAKLFLLFIIWQGYFQWWLQIIFCCDLYTISLDVWLFLFQSLEEKFKEFPGLFEALYNYEHQENLCF